MAEASREGRTPSLSPSGLGLGCGHSSPGGLRACSARFQSGLRGLITCLPGFAFVCVHACVFYVMCLWGG